jgi:transcriptional regulator with XRE-family HTH domain
MSGSNLTLIASPLKIDNMAKNQTISDTLRKAASKSGTRELARAADIDPGTVHRFVNGHNIRSDQLDQIAEALGFELRQLTKGSSNADG